MNSRVAILMRTRERKIFLPRALQSVLLQSFKDWHLYVINDGGDLPALKDFLLPYQEKFSSKLTILPHEKSTESSIAAPLNLGIRSSQSEFIAVHDDDDSWHPDFLQSTVSFLQNQKNKKFGGCVAKTKLVYEKISNSSIEEVRSEIYNEWQQGAISLFRLAETNTFAPIALLFRREVMQVIGERHDQYGPLEDWEFNLRLLSHFPVALLPDLLANYHQRILESSQGTQANFFASSSALYGGIDTEIRNELLRKDLASGKFGLGLVASLSNAHGQLFQKIHSCEDALKKFE